MATAHNRLAALELSQALAERRRATRMSLAEIEAELATLDRPGALRFIGALSDGQLERLVALSPGLQALSDAELEGLLEAGDGFRPSDR